MTETTSTVPANASAAELDSEKQHQRITTVAWLVGISAVAGFGSVSEHASFGEGLAFVGVSAMVTVVSCAILRLK